MKEYFNLFDDIQFFSYIFINISRYIDSNAKPKTRLYSEFFALQDDVFFEPQIRVFKPPFFAILRTFSSITREICVQIKNTVHHDNQLSDLDLMMYIQLHITFIKIFHTTLLHTTELFKIFFSLLTLSTAFLQKAGGPGKIYYNVPSLTDTTIIRQCSLFYNLKINLKNRESFTFTQL